MTEDFVTTNTNLLSDAQEARKTLEAIREHLNNGNKTELSNLIQSLHYADTADMIEALKFEERLQIISHLPQDTEADIFLDLDPEVRSTLLEYASPKLISRIFNTLESDDAFYIIEHLNFEQQAEILRFLSKQEQDFFNEALTYEEHTAVRLMQLEKVVVPKFWTVSQVKRYIKTNEDLPEEIYNIYIIDSKNRPLGYVSLSELLKHKDDEKVAHFMNTDIISFAMETPQKEVAFYFRRYGLTSAPILDKSGTIKGDITLNHIVDLIDEEAERAFLGLAGVYKSDTHSLVKTAGDRFKWVMITAVSSFVSSWVIQQFDESIEKIVALAVLMSIVVSISGTVSLQVASVTIRALSNGEFRLVKIWHNLWKEMCVGFLIGVLISTVLFIMIFAWYDDLSLSIVFAVSILLNTIYASIIGISIPTILFKLNYDPAISGPPFLIPVCDVFGYGSFLYFATLYLF